MKKEIKKEAGLYRFFLLWISQSISQLGSAMTGFALILWAYEQKGTAMSTVSMAIFNYLPYILVSFVAGALADRWRKKSIMLACDSIAAAGSLLLLLLTVVGKLELWHVYLINFIIGGMNAFQQPAAMVAVTLLTPKKYYHKVSGMQAFSNALVSILQPALATAVMALGGLRAVLLIDLASFAIAFYMLAFYIPVPEEKKPETTEKENFWKQNVEGIRYLKRRKAIWNMILFFAWVNLLASMAGNSLMPAMILSRSGNDRQILGMVSSCLGIGSLCGGVVTSLMKPPKHRRAMIFLSCGISFLLCDVLWGLGQHVWIWTAAAFLGNFPLPFLNAAMSSVMREQIPVNMQGRAFSTQAAFQFFTIPLGYLLGGVLSDYIFEPFMAGNSWMSQICAGAVGTGRGSGMALIFLFTGSIGFITNMMAFFNPIFKELDR